MSIANDEDKLNDRAIKYERFGLLGGISVIVGLLFEVGLAWKYAKGHSILEEWGPVFADTLVAAGVATEVFFAAKARSATEIIRQLSNEKVASAVECAANADLTRAELEAKLLPRILNQAQWDFIQSLKGKFSIVSIAYETDAETAWFAGQIRDAFFAAGISVAMYPRAADVHSFGTFIFEPNGFDGARPRTVVPLLEIFHLADSIVSLAIIAELPSDFVISIGNTRPEMRAPLDAPMIILGGRFVLPPPHIEKAATAAKAAMDRMRNDARILRKSSI